MQKTAGTVDQAETPKPPTSPRTKQLLAPMFVLFPITCIFAFWPGHDTPPPQVDEPGVHAKQVLTAIDPNTAPWPELTALPRIGEVTARKIVAYREEHAEASPDQPAFSQPNELERVHGIGPKTVEKLRPFLRFPQADANATSANSGH